MVSPRASDLGGPARDDTDLARTARVTGNVTVFLIVSEKGEVESVIRAEGPQQLQQAAIEAARRWKFNTTEIDGKPVRVTGYLNFSFTL